jgi:cation diffusion facilitator CzcD-associated flavoprotein CzcO
MADPVKRVEPIVLVVGAAAAAMASAPRLTREVVHVISASTNDLPARMPVFDVPARREPFYARLPRYQRRRAG